MEEKSLEHQIQNTNELKEALARKDRDLEEMKTSLRVLESMFDGTRDEVMVLDPEFTIMDANRAFLDRYGLAKAAVVGRKCHEIKGQIKGPCTLGDNNCPLVRARETGKRVEMKHSHRKQGGIEKEFSLTMYPIFSGTGVPACFLEIAREVTDYRNLAVRLRESEKKFRAILDTATNAILSIDENHKIILFNNAAQKIFGYSREQILRKNLDILVPDRYGHHERFVRRFLEKKNSTVIGQTLSLTALRKGGEEFPIELSLSCMELDGKTTFTAIIRDISDKQVLEKKLLQSERLAAVGQAVAHVAHEIKNPLMIIGGFSSQMKNSVMDSKDIDKLDVILEEVRRLERLVAGLGDFTKTYSLVKRMTSVNDIIRDVIKIMVEVYPPDIYSFHERLSAGIRDIDCDPDKLKQVFINVISNGCEAMTHGGAITVATGHIPAGVEIRISDEGVGIPEHDLQHIFEPFFTTRERGSGLGLSVSYKIVEAHKGEISAVSRPGQGTTFIIRLPL
ncbi:MAG: PAS domain-containing sensor histidine kinase [Desulfatiglandales bacterium]